MADDEVPECESCYWPTHDLTPSSRSGERAEPLMLCEVCRNTLIGNAALYPRQYENSALYSSLGWIANKVLDEIRKGQGS